MPLRLFGRIGTNAVLAARRGPPEKAGLDELETDRVHEVKESGGAVRIPPGGGEAIEVGDFGGVDGGAGGAVVAEELGICWVELMGVLKGWCSEARKYSGEMS